MASHYDRMASQYATRPSPIAGPSRGDPFYDREHRAVYPSRPETDYIEEEHLLARQDDRPYYPPQDYIGPPRESRGEIWTNPWPRRPSVYPPRPSPPPVSTQYPRYYQDSRPAPPPQWEERSRWENPPEDHAFEPSIAWRHARREPSYPRLNSLLNPVPPSPGIDDHRWREPIPGPSQPPPPRDYGRSYAPDFHSYDDRHPVYYDRSPFPESNSFRPNDTYRQLPNERPSPSHWETPTYRPEIAPAPRASRPSVVRDYGRQRQVSVGQSPRHPESDTPHWIRERGVESGRHSREVSLSSPAPVDINERERTATGSSQLGTRSVMASSTPSSPPTMPLRNAWDASSDELEFSGDESVKGMTRPAQALKQTLNDITRSRDVLRENDKHKENQVTPSSFNRVVSNRPLFMSVEKDPDTVIRRAWDPSTDQYIPIMDNNAGTSLQAEGGIRGPTTAMESFNHTDSESALRNRRISQVQHNASASRVNGISSVKKGPSGVQFPNDALGSSSSRQGVMSVKDLVSHSSVKPYTPATLSQSTPTPLVMGDDDMQVDELRGEVPSRSARISEVSAPLPTRTRLVETKENSFDRSSFSATSQTTAAPQRGTERQRSISNEPPVTVFSQAVTPDIRTPDPDADKTLIEVEGRIAEATLSSPKPLVLLQPGEKISQDGTMRILAPRPKADEKDITEILRKAIVLRRAFSTQSREQRVNPILMDNLAKADGPEQQAPLTLSTLVDEAVDCVLTRSEEEHHMNIRAVLATNFAEQQELLAEKTQRLRDEYMLLNERWVAHCAHLDSLFKANDMQEALTQAGRTTRRSAATLGDAVRSDLEMEQIIASLGNEDMTDPNHLAVRNVATIPDMIIVEKGRVDYLFDDTNNLVEDPESFYDLRSGFYDWTPEEEQVYYARYAEYPKQFGIIAEFLPHKTASQCVLYYYIHKKRLIDFRNAANSGNGKRRKGVRKTGKQKGNALLVDVQQADSKRPAGRGRRRGRGGFADAGRGRGFWPAPSVELSTDADPRPKRRKVINTSKQFEYEDALSVDTDNTREASVVPPKKRRGRKPKSAIATESPGASPAPGETTFIEVNETTSRRKPGTTSTHWSESDREIFMRLLARHGKDFKRISAELPNKTTVQVGNYYKNHNRELGLEKIALAAANRKESPEQDCFVNVSRAEASQSRTPTEEISPDQLFDRQVADATSGVDVLTLEQNGKPGQSVFRTATNPRAITNKSVINVLSPDAFQSAGTSRPRGVIISNGQSAYTLGVARQPARPQPSSTMTSTTMNLRETPPSFGSSHTGTVQDTATQAQDRSKPALPIAQYSFQPHMPMAVSESHEGPVSFIPASKTNVPNMPTPTKVAQSSHGLGDYRSGIPIHLLPTSHRVSANRGFSPPTLSQGMSQAPWDTSRQPGRQE